MLNVCMSGCVRASGLAALSFCAGVIAGMCLPVVVVAAIEMLLLIVFGYLCLFKW